MKFKCFGEIVDSKKDEINPIEYEDSEMSNGEFNRIVINDDSIMETIELAFTSVLDNIKEMREIDRTSISILESLMSYVDYNLSDYDEYTSEPYEWRRLKGVIDDFYSHRPSYLKPIDVHMNIRCRFREEDHLSFYLHGVRKLDNGLHTFMCPECKKGELRFHHNDWQENGIVTRCTECNNGTIIGSWFIDPKTDRIRLPIGSYNFSSVELEEVKKRYLATPLFAVFPANER